MSFLTDPLLQSHYKAKLDKKKTKQNSTTYMKIFPCTNIVRERTFFRVLVGVSQKWECPLSAFKKLQWIKTHDILLRPLWRTVFRVSPSSRLLFSTILFYLKHTQWHATGNFYILKIKIFRRCRVKEYTFLWVQHHWPIQWSWFLIQCGVYMCVS